MCIRDRFRCNLPPSLFAERPGPFARHCGKMGVERTLNKSTQSYFWRRKFSRYSCQDSNSQSFDHGSSAFTNKLSCVFVHDGSNHWALPIQTTFSDLDCISRSHQCQKVLMEHFMFWSDKVQTLYDCWLHQVGQEYTTSFYFCTCSRDIIYSLSEKTFNIGLF